MLFEGESDLTGISGYFASITATALIGVVLLSLVKDPRKQSILRTVAGLMLLLVVMKPLKVIDLQKLGQDMKRYLQKEFPTTDYEELYQEKLRQQIISTTEKYIMEKAAALNAIISVTVELSHGTDTYPVPCGIKIYGSVSKEQRTQLETYFTEELGIVPENIRWDEYEQSQ